MDGKKEILIISNINDIKIKKVQPWGIHFDYAGKHYFLHRYNDWDDALNLYEKTYVIDEKHKKGDYYELNCIASKYINPKCFTDYFVRDSISQRTFSNENKKFSKEGSITYKFIDKYEFAYKLEKVELATISFSSLSKIDIKKLKEAKYRDEKKTEVKVNKYTLRKLLEKTGVTETDTNFILDNLYKLEEFVNSNKLINKE